MRIQSLEVGDIFRAHGPAWRQSQTNPLSVSQLKVMSAIERCRQAELGGHQLQCPDCGYAQNAYNSCRNRHCPKCQGSAAKRWLIQRKQDLLPVDYYHVVFTLPSQINDIAYQNKAVIYSLLFKAASQTLLTIAADPKHLSAHIGVTMILHTWGSALTHHPHVHCIVPGGGLSITDGSWVNCKAGFFLPVRVLSKLFRRLFLEMLNTSYENNELRFSSKLSGLTEAKRFQQHIAPMRQYDWAVYAKRPFAGAEAVFAYLARYTHRVAISNSRLVALDEHGVTFKWKDYRIKGRSKHRVMTLAASEFIRRFLIHILPKGFHRIRYYGLFANTVRRCNLDRARQALNVDVTPQEDGITDTQTTSIAEPPTFLCPQCSAVMIVIALLERPGKARAPPKLEIAA